MCVGNNAAKIANDKIKGVALMVRNVGLVLASAAIAKVYAEGIGLVVASWMVISAVMAYSGIELLSLMQPED